MANTYSAGIATAYGAAKRGGYTGTYDEWCALMADYATVGEQAQQAASDAAASEANAAQSAAAAASSESNAAQSAQNAAQSASSAATSAEGAYASEEAAAQSAEDASSSASAAAASATNAAASEAAAAGSATTAAQELGKVQAEGETQTAAITAEGERVLDSIPADYTALSDEVGDLKSQINVATSFNKLDPSARVENANISNSAANLGEIISGVYIVTGPIGVCADDVITGFSSNDALDTPPARMAIAVSAFRVAEYDADGNCLLCTPNWAAFPYSIRNANTAYVRLALPTWNWWMITINDPDISQKAYVAYEPEPNIATSNRAFIENLTGRVSDVENQLEYDVILPSAIYGVDGQEINIYKENLVLPKRLRTMPYLHTRIKESVQDDYRTIWTPVAEVMRAENINFEVCYGDGTVKNYPIAYYMVPKDTGSGSIKALIIGDSKVQNGYVSYHFLHNFDDDNMTCTLLGTRYSWQTDNRHEGYGSRTAKWFCTDAASPFCNNGAFDFAHYLEANDIQTPGYVFINLGTNDCAGSPGSNDNYLTDFVGYMTQMIASIHGVDDSIRVIVGLCEGCATVLDTNNSEFRIWDLNAKISRLHKACIEAFDKRQNENIWVCPMYMGMDLTQDYAMTEKPLSQRDADVNGGQGNGKTRMQINDRIHQNEVGSWKNADYMYALVKYIVAKSQA